MRNLSSYPMRLLIAGVALGSAAVIGWGSFAYVTVTSNQRIVALSAERDVANADRRLLIEKAGQLADFDEKAASVRADHSRALQGLAEVKAKTVLAQQELATLARRATAASDRVSQTGSIRQPEPPKRPAR